MKMVKSLLLGSAAGIVAVAGAQAAELPVKAKPVEYVKICSLYGAGFFYIPGTDTCIKLGGAVRVQAEYNTGSGGIPVGFGNTAEAGQGAFTRALTNDVNFRTRIYFSVDVRQQTDYGTLRSYVRFGVNQTTPVDGGGASSTGTAYWDRAFIQFAGFTVGRTVSFFDAITAADFDYNNSRTLPDSGAAGITLWAYTAQFGNGISGTLSAEDPNGRAKLVDDFNAAAWTFGANINANGLAANVGGNGFGFPDVVGALRVDQAWGSAQIAAAMHDASGQYYVPGIVSSGHPDNAFGWAVSPGFAINLPGWGATGIANSQPNVDQFKAEAVYSRGASGYATNGNGPSFLADGNTSAAVGWLVDGVYGNGLLGTGLAGTDVNLTTAWSVWAGYQHIWTPNWRTSLYGGFLDVTYGDGATALICAPSTGGTIGGVGLVFKLQPGSVCDPNFSIWQVGTRTQWNPVSQLDIGVDVLFSRLNTAFDGATTITTLPGKQTGLISFSDQDVWSVMFRVQRNFWP